MRMGGWWWWMIITFIIKFESKFTSLIRHYLLELTFKNFFPQKREEESSELLTFFIYNHVVISCPP